MTDFEVFDQNMCINTYLFQQSVIHNVVHRDL